WSLGVAPAGAASVSVFIGSFPTDAQHLQRFEIRNARISLEGEPTAALDGADGANYFWTGAANASTSVLHAPATAGITTPDISVEAGKDYWFSGYVLSETVARDAFARITWYGSSSSLPGIPVAVLGT